MEFRQLGRSGFKVPVLSFGTGTFGGSNEFFRAWGNSGVPEATKLVDICLEAGCNMFDTADIYSDGESAAATKFSFPPKPHSKPALLPMTSARPAFI
jgi:aryl-alcohol dehydrogenase-like predicted oxidoreductase